MTENAMRRGRFVTGDVLYEETFCPGRRGDFRNGPLLTPFY